MTKRYSVLLPQALALELSAFAKAKKISEVAAIEAAVTSYLFAQDPKQREMALEQRLDQFIRHLRFLRRNVTIASEAHALFIRYWLTHTPALPDTVRAAAQAKGHERFQQFVQALGNRLAKGTTLENVIVGDLETFVAQAKKADRKADDDN